jgi:hypothetical protein
VAAVRFLNGVDGQTANGIDAELIEIAHDDSLPFVRNLRGTADRNGIVFGDLSCPERQCLLL